MLTLAVSKGRIWDEASALLAKTGYAADNAAVSPRSLVIPTAQADVRLVIVRGQDTPTYVASGAAEAGIIGGDVLAEKSLQDMDYPLDLRIARCRMVAAAKAGFVLSALSRKPTVATKYPNLARQYFAGLGVSAHYIKLHGTMELAPTVGLADIIVDVADTGDTLRAHGLEEIGVVMRISAKFVVNRAAWRRNPAVATMARRLQAATESADSADSVE